VSCPFLVGFFGWRGSEGKRETWRGDADVAVI
jgi:hypothetical protein